MVCRSWSFISFEESGWKYDSRVSVVLSMPIFALLGVCFRTRGMGGVLEVRLRIGH
jgi:hypothetical protein